MPLVDRPPGVGRGSPGWSGQDGEKPRAACHGDRDCSRGAAVTYGGRRDQHGELPRSGMHGCRGSYPWWHQTHGMETRSATHAARLSRGWRQVSGFH